MNMTKPFEVRITPNQRLELILINQESENAHTHSHPPTAEEAEQFADTLEAALASGTYSKLERCPLCGRFFTRQNRLCLLHDGRIIHTKCLRPAVKQGTLSYDDCEEYSHRCFPKDIPAADFSNLLGPNYNLDFRYAIQTVSKAVVHLYLTQKGKIPTRHYCLTYDECLALVQDIRDKLAELYCSVTEHCAFCGQPVYMDQPKYEMTSGEVIHGVCMERFIRSEGTAKVTFPAKLIQCRNAFGFVQKPFCC